MLRNILLTIQYRFTSYSEYDLIAFVISDPTYLLPLFDFSLISNSYTG
jgi:hypothetical protein